MTPPIALQLYTVRDAMASDFAGTINKIAEIGYPFVEAGGIPQEISTKTAGKIIAETGMQVIGAHVPLPLGDQKNLVLDTMAKLDSNHIVSPWMDPSHYKSEASIRKLADQFNEAAQVAGENGHRFSVHNHWFEFEPINGAPAYQVLLKYLAPEVLFEIDLYWVQTAGIDPAGVLKELGARAPLVHVKDGPADKIESNMVAVGQGSLDFPAIFKAGAPYSEVHIVELDRCDTDMMTAVEESYRYMTANGFSNGR